MFRSIETLTVDVSLIDFPRLFHGYHSMSVILDQLTTKVCLIHWFLLSSSQLCVIFMKFPQSPVYLPQGLTNEVCWTHKQHGQLISQSNQELHTAGLSAQRRGRKKQGDKFIWLLGGEVWLMCSCLQSTVGLRNEKAGRWCQWHVHYYFPAVTAR